MTKGEKIYGYKKRENFYTVKEVVEHNTSKDILKEEKRDYQFDFGGIPDMIRDHSGKISIISDYDVDGVCCSLILDMILVFLQKWILKFMCQEEKPMDMDYPKKSWIKCLEH